MLTGGSPLPNKGTEQTLLTFSSPRVMCANDTKMPSRSFVLLINVIEYYIRLKQHVVPKKNFFLAEAGNNVSALKQRCTSKSKT
jgi:hypothetical protein